MLVEWTFIFQFCVREWPSDYLHRLQDDAECHTFYGSIARVIRRFLFVSRSVVRFRVSLSISSKRCSDWCAAFCFSCALRLLHISLRMKPICARFVYAGSAHAACRSEYTFGKNVKYSVGFTILPTHRKSYSHFTRAKCNDCSVLTMADGPRQFHWEIIQ